MWKHPITHGTKGLPPDGATGFRRDTSRMIFCVRFGVMWKRSKASRIIGSSFFRRSCARRRRLRTVFADIPKNSPICALDISLK